MGKKSMVTPSKRYAWLNPEIAMYLGYALYKASDPAMVETPNQKLAQGEAAYLLQLTTAYELSTERTE